VKASRPHASATQQPQQARRARLFQNELPHDVDEGARIAGAVLRQFGYTIEALVEDGHSEQRAFGEMTIQRRLTDGRTLSNAVQRHVRTVAGQQFCEGLEDGCAIALGVDAAYSAWLFKSPYLPRWTRPSCPGNNRTALSVPVRIAERCVWTGFCTPQGGRRRWPRGSPPRDGKLDVGLSVKELSGDGGQAQSRSSCLPLLRRASSPLCWCGARTQPGYR
jgi:hypothetical protein